MSVHFYHTQITSQKRHPIIDELFQRHRYERQRAMQSSRLDLQRSHRLHFQLTSWRFQASRDTLKRDLKNIFFYQNWITTLKINILKKRFSWANSIRKNPTFQKKKRLKSKRKTAQNYERSVKIFKTFSSPFTNSSSSGVSSRRVWVYWRYTFDLDINFSKLFFYFTFDYKLTTFKV